MQRLSILLQDQTERYNLNWQQTELNQITVCLLCRVPLSVNTPKTLKAQIKSIYSVKKKEDADHLTYFLVYMCWRIGNVCMAQFNDEESI